MGSKRDDVSGGLRESQLPITKIEKVLLVLVSGQLLEEFGRICSLVLTGRLGLGGVQIIQHLTIIFIS